MPQANMDQAIKELYMWQRGMAHGSKEYFFTAKLYELMCKADPENMLALSKGFPYEAKALMSWVASGNVYEFFKRYGYDDKIFFKGE